MRFLRRLFFLLFLAVGGAAAWLFWFASNPLSLHGGNTIEFSISPGSSLRSASQQMSDAGVGFAAWQFTLLARLLGKSAEIKAGSYELERGTTPWLLLG